MKERGLWIVIIVAFIFLMMFIVSILPKNFTPETIPTSEQEIADNCDNLSIRNTAKCICDNLKTFYIYNVTDDNNHLDFSDFLERGGDCNDWARMIQRIGIKLGFYNKRVDFVTDIDSGHTIVILADPSGYCFFSNINYWCSEFKNG